MIDSIIKNDLKNVENSIANFTGLFKDKNFLVTGGSGFLGSWICDALIKLGASVTCQDNFSSGLESNIDHLYDNDNFCFVKLDIREKVPIGNYDGIFHMASRASPDDYHLHQVETLLTNAEGIKNVLNLAKKNNCECIYSSTSEIYGDAKIVPTPENYWGNVNSLGERSCYDEGKRYGEAYCMAYRREFGTDVRIVRIFNTYGPRIRPDGPYGRALPRFVLRALRNDSINIFGDGFQTRSFCYVSDTVIGILLLFATKTDCPVFNIGNDKELTINELAKSIVDKTSSQSKICYKEKMPDDPTRRNPDISNAKKILDWVPTISLDDGLERTIEWISKHRNMYDS